MVITFIDFQNETSFQTDVLRYSCSNFDYCKIDFLFKHIHWLIIDKYQPEFGNSILSLLHRGNISSSMYSLNQSIQFNSISFLTLIQSFLFFFLLFTRCFICLFALYRCRFFVARAFFSFLPTFVFHSVVKHKKSNLWLNQWMWILVIV